MNRIWEYIVGFAGIGAFLGILSKIGPLNSDVINTSNSSSIGTAIFGLLYVATFLWSLSLFENFKQLTAKKTNRIFFFTLIYTVLMGLIYMLSYNRCFNEIHDGITQQTYIFPFQDIPIEKKFENKTRKEIITHLGTQIIFELENARYVEFSEFLFIILTFIFVTPITILINLFKHKFRDFISSIIQ